MAKQKKKNTNLIMIFIALIIISSIYFVVMVVSLLKQPLDTTLVRNGELVNYENASGYIIRDEKVIDTNGYSGKVKEVKAEGDRVAKGEVIVSFVTTSEAELNDKINEVDKQIQSALESQQSIFSNDIKTLDSQIEELLFNLRSYKNDIYKVTEYKKAINEKIEKKAKIAGELSPAGSYIKTLIEKREGYEKEINQSKKSLKADATGVVSYRVDNLENILTEASISRLTIEQLNQLKIQTGLLIPLNNQNVKIVDNFSCYIAVPMYSEDSRLAQVNDKVYFRFNEVEEEYVPATIEYISEEDDARLIVFKISSHVEELIKYRKINLDVVWWRYKGFKIPNRAIQKDENQIPYVLTVKSSYTEKVYTKIVRQAGDFSIIENYTSEELKELGLSEEEAKNKKTIKLYDEIMMHSD